MILCHQSYEFTSIECHGGEGLTIIDICKANKKEVSYQMTLLKCHDEIMVKN